MARDRLRFLRNGVPHTLDAVGPNETLLDYLRLREGKKGTKEGCNEGDCGACTVALGRVKDGRLVYEPVNACILLLGQIDGKDLVTVDDLAVNGQLHPVQQAMVEHHGSQCGFCTPGFIMSMFTLYHAGIRPERNTINDWLAGNLCRCTGYRPIVDATRAALANKREDHVSERANKTARLLNENDDNEDLFIGSEHSFIAAPASKAALARLYEQHPDAIIVSGATDVGLWITKQMRDLPKVILTGRARDFANIVETAHSITLGAGVTYEDATQVLGNIDPDIGEVLRRLGSKQVRASGTIGGNIANGSPIGDSPPLLIALDAELELLKGESVRNLPLEKYFIDYGQQDRKAGELVSAIHIPRLKPDQHFRAWKISKRFDQDISALLGAFRLTVSNGTISEARIAFGGMAAVPKRATTTEKLLIGKALNDQNGLQAAANALEQDFSPISDMRASADYRMKIARNLLFKAVYEIAGGDNQLTRVVGVRKTPELSL
jgi:xanthine dehydrogenase small subunit